MNNSNIIYGILVLFWSLVLTISCVDNKRLWGKIDSPHLDYKITLYQKDRIMHKTPEILVYFQKKGSLIMRPLGNILLPEDDRIILTYDYEWEKSGNLALTLHCQKCMIDQRKYKINLGQNPNLSQVLVPLAKNSTHKAISEKY